MAFERALDLLLHYRRNILDDPAEFPALARLEKQELEQIEAALAHLGWKPRATYWFTADDFSKEINADERYPGIVIAALRIAAAVVRPGVIEDAIKSVLGENDGKPAHFVRRALTDAS